jgi:hypothetical protein
MESPPVWFSQERLNLFAIVVVVSAFLVHGLGENHQGLLQTMLRLTCPRTGKRSQQALVPLYRLRWAISRLWHDCRPLLGRVFPPDWETIQGLALLQGEKGSSKMRDDS